MQCMCKCKAMWMRCNARQMQSNANAMHSNAQQCNAKLCKGKARQKRSKRKPPNWGRAGFIFDFCFMLGFLHFWEWYKMMHWFPMLCQWFPLCFHCFSNGIHCFSIVFHCLFIAFRLVSNALPMVSIVFSLLFQWFPVLFHWFPVSIAFSLLFHWFPLLFIALHSFSNHFPPLSCYFVSIPVIFPLLHFFWIPLGFQEMLANSTKGFQIQILIKNRNYRDLIFVPKCILAQRHPRQAGNPMHFQNIVFRLV